MNLSFKRFGFALESCRLVSGTRYLGYKYMHHGGDFYCFGFWFWHIYITTSPHCYLSEEEIAANIALHYKNIDDIAWEMANALDKHLEDNNIQLSNNNDEYPDAFGIFKAGIYYKGKK